MPTTDVLPGFLTCLDSKLDHLSFTLSRTRQALIDVQQNIGKDVALLGRIGAALTSVRDSERLLADLQQQVTAIRQDTEPS